MPILLLLMHGHAATERSRIPDEHEPAPRAGALDADASSRMEPREGAAMPDQSILMAKAPNTGISPGPLASKIGMNITLA